VDVKKQFSNKEETEHRFEKPREYVRALNAVKLQKIYAHPFVGALNGHSDTPITIAKHPNSLTHIVSGSCDGMIKVWDLSSM